MITKKFGIERVLEPKGSVPAISWKLDNDRKLKKDEILIGLRKIHIEWDSFQQICNACSFNEEKIKEKIRDIVNRRGKLHNPFTGSGGSMEGILVEIGKEYKGRYAFDGECLSLYDEVYSLTSLRGIPLYIDEIKSIDYDYGQIECTGYGILFEASPIEKVRKNFDKPYMLAAVNEGGFLKGAYEVMAKIKEKSDIGEIKKVAVIGRNLSTGLLFGGSCKLSNDFEKFDKNVEISLFMDKDSFDDKNYFDSTNPFGAINKVEFVDFSDPFRTLKNIKEEFDLVIIAEDQLGAETIGVLLAKEKGKIYFTAVTNYFPIAQTVAESLSKDVKILAFDQYMEDYIGFTHKVVDFARDDFEKLEKLYKNNRVERVESEQYYQEEQNKKLAGKNRGLLGSEKSYDDEIEAHKNLEGFLYKDKKMSDLVDEVLNVSKYDCNVIIQGETGTGKEKIMTIIHENSERKSNPCIKINCATIQESLAESEFFGYEQGAFTGAKSKGKKGYFEMANNGILFLDEIGTLPMNMQSKLLRVLQENTYYRVGGTKQISVNVRAIAANNIPLLDLVKKGEFREDLYYRLNICNIVVPSLRDRKGDIELLTKAFCKNLEKKYNVKREFSKEAIRLLENYDFPGNVRELENIVHRLVIKSKEQIITKELVRDDFLSNDIILKDISYYSEDESVESISPNYDKLAKKPDLYDELKHKHINKNKKTPNYDDMVKYRSCDNQRAASEEIKIQSPNYDKLVPKPNLYYEQDNKNPNRNNTSPNYDKYFVEDRRANYNGELENNAFDSQRVTNKETSPNYDASDLEERAFNIENPIDFRTYIEDREKELIKYALKNNKSIRAAARFLGLPQTTFVRKKEKYKI